MRPPHKILRKRRENLANYMMSNGVLVICASSAKFESGGYEHPYIPNKYLYYLTGFDEPDAVLVMTVDEKKITRELLFCRPRNKKSEQWGEERMESRSVSNQLGILESQNIEKFANEIHDILSNYGYVYYLPMVILNMMINCANCQYLKKCMMLRCTWIKCVPSKMHMKLNF